MNAWNKKDRISGSAVSATLPTMPLGDITGGSSSDYMRLPMKPQKALNCFFKRAVVLPRTREHTVMCTNGGVTL